MDAENPEAEPQPEAEAAAPEETAAEEAAGAAETKKRKLDEITKDGANAETEAAENE